MSNQTPDLAAETEALKAAYAALNRGDVPGFVKDFDPQIERVELLGVPQGETWHGLAAVTEHVATARATWAEGGCEPQRFIIAGDKVVVVVDVRVRLKHEREWREGRTADVFTFRDGKAIEFRTFAVERQALQWAGIEAVETN
jgi:ketosteroid isomerase-like protein